VLHENLRLGQAFAGEVMKDGAAGLGEAVAAELWLQGVEVCVAHRLHHVTCFSLSRHCGGGKYSSAPVDMF
jgi:hypothetical protein